MSVTKRIKYFKQIAILLTIFWTILTSLFVVYQFNSEARHIEKNSLEKIKGVTEQSVAFIYWAYEQKAQALNDEQKYSIKNNFSLKELLYVLARQSSMDLHIESMAKNVQEKNSHPAFQKALVSMKNTQEDSFVVFEEEGRKNIFYIKPLIANQSCISCHVHDDSKIGDLIGFTSVRMLVPNFNEANPQSYYFLIIMYIGTWILGIFAIWWIHSRGKNYLNEKTKLYEESMYALVNMMEKRDSYTAGHSKRVAEYSKMLVLGLGYTPDDADFIYKAGMLHDIGKIEIPDAVLLKPEKLTSEEYSLIQYHSKASFELLKHEPFKVLSKVVLHHHEHYDGKGYPDGLIGENIPFFSQIIAVADAFDAMTTNRAYRKSMTRVEALAILDEESGKQFNPRIVKVAQTVFSDIFIPEDTTQMPKDLLEEMRFSYYFRDQLTGYYNINYLKFMFAHTDDKRVKMFFIDHLNCVNFSIYNKKYGWKKGDEFLTLMAKTIESIYPKAIIVRAYSHNFLVLHLDEHQEINYAEVDALMEENGLKITYQHIELDTNETLSLEILEDKILHLEV